jgi:KDO2-lipid IV(A) lauroyltransferase
MAKLKDSVEYAIFKILEFLLLFLPRKIGLAVGALSGCLVYGVDKKHRQIALSNLNTALGTQLSSFEIKRIAKSCFKHFGRAFVDILKIRRLSPKEINRLMIVEGEEHLRESFRLGRGILLFSAHLGSWEIASAFFSQKGKLSVIARHLDNKSLEEELSGIRKAFGATVIYKHQAARSILRALQANEMVALLIDQNVIRSQAVFVDFFGKPAATTPSLAAFYLKTRAPLIPVFCFPASGQKYYLQIQKPLEIALTGEEKTDVLKITQLCTKIIQSQIEKHPEFWFWFHNRWKTRPEEDKGSCEEET